MADIVECPQCHRQLRVPESLTGQSVKCPSCATVFTAGATTEVPRPPDEPIPFKDEGEQPVPSRRRPEEEDVDDDHPRHRARRDLDPHRGVLILVFGILSVVFFLPGICCGILPVLGGGLGLTSWILGQRDLRAMRENRMDPEGMGLTRGGWICGIIGTVLNALMLLFQIGIIIFQVVLASQGR